MVISPADLVPPHPGGLNRLRVTAPGYEATCAVYGTGPVQALGTVGGRDRCVRAGHEGRSFEVTDHAGGLPPGRYRGSDGF